MSLNAIKLYRHPRSGESQRVELMLGLLGLPTEVVPVNLMRPRQMTAGAVQQLRYGQAPVIDDHGTVVSDSNAILIYLAATYGKSQWLPCEHVKLAKVLRWLSLSEGEPWSGDAGGGSNIALSEDHDALDVFKKTLRLLRDMDRQLAVTDFLADEKPTIADVSAYVYVSHSSGGHISLSTYPNVRKWMTALESLPRFMELRPAG